MKWAAASETTEGINPMGTLHPIREGYVTRIDSAPEPNDASPFSGFDDGCPGVPVTPPREVLDALDRAAQVMSELGEKNVTLALERTGAGSVRAMLHHPGSPSRELSHRALLNLLDGDTSVVDGLDWPLFRPRGRCSRGS